MKKLQISQPDFQDIAQTVLGGGNSFSFQAHGNSMAPFIVGGDTVYLKQSFKYTVGDVVLLKNNKMLLLHRIINKTTSGVITKGDASSIEDLGPIEEVDILGKVYKISGQGYNFHLRFPYKYLLTRRSFTNFFLQKRIFRKIGKFLFRILG